MFFKAFNLSVVQIRSRLSKLHSEKTSLFKASHTGSCGRNQKVMQLVASHNYIVVTYNYAN